MSDNEGLDFLEIYELLKSRARQLLVITIVAGALTAGFCQTRTHWYAYTALMKPAVRPLGTAAMAMSAASLPRSLMGSRESTAADQALTYVQFRYINVRRTPDEVRKPYLDEIRQSEQGDLLVLTAKGVDPESAKSHLEAVLADLQKWYAPQIETSRANSLEKLQALEGEIQKLERQYVQVENGMREVGFNPMLLQQLTSVEQALLMAKTQVAELRSDVSAPNLSNFQYVDLRPVDPNGPVSPQTFKISLAVSFLAFVMGLTWFLLSHSLGKLRRIRALSSRDVALAIKSRADSDDSSSAA